MDNILFIPATRETAWVGDMLPGTSPAELPVAGEQTTILSPAVRTRRPKSVTPSESIVPVTFQEVFLLENSMT